MAETAESVDLSQGAQVLFDQVFELWVNPEIERRKAKGLIAEPFGLQQVQVVFNLDWDRPEVRINSEVRAIVSARGTRDVKAGEPVTESDVSEIASVVLTDDDPDAGHITMIVFKGYWCIHFSFLYNAGRIRFTIQTAEEFLQTAKLALAASCSRAFVANLFQAVEAVAKGVLFSSHNMAVLDTNTHKVVRSELNRLSHRGLIDGDFARLLNELDLMKNDARYGLKPWNLEGHKAKQLVDKADEFVAVLRNRAPPRSLKTT